MWGYPPDCHVMTPVMTQALILFLCYSTGNGWILNNKYKWPLWSINLYMVLRPTILVLFSLNMIHLAYNLRNSENKLAVPLLCTNFLKNSFSYNGTVIWNSLSPELRQAKSLQSFWNGCRDFFVWIEKNAHGIYVNQNFFNFPYFHYLNFKIMFL